MLLIQTLGPKKLRPYRFSVFSLSVFLLPSILPSSSLSLSFHLSPFTCLSLFISLSCQLTLSLLKDRDNDHSFSRLSLCAAMNTSVHGPLPIRSFGECSYHARKISIGIPVLASCQLVSSGPAPALMEQRCASLTLESIAGEMCAMLLCGCGAELTAGKEVWCGVMVSCCVVAILLLCDGVSSLCCWLCVCCVKAPYTRVCLNFNHLHIHSRHGDIIFATFKRVMVTPAVCPRLFEILTTLTFGAQRGCHTV